MKKVFLLPLILFGVLLVGCRNAPEIPAVPHDRISVEEAEGLVRDWIFEKNPDMNPKEDFPLEETTTEEVWRRTGGQLFKIKDGNVLLFMTLFIRDKQVLPLGISFGGFGITDIYVMDLDQDGEVELLYTFSWGSGIHRSHIAIYNFSLEKEILAEFTFWHGDLVFEKIDDQTVFVYSAEVGLSDGNVTFTPENKLGQVILSETDGEMILSVIDENGNELLEETQKY
jgi:hypothetical protein